MTGIGKVGKEGWWNGVRGGEREREKERERDWDGERENTAKEILLLRSQGGAQGGGMLEVYHFSRGHTSTIWIVLCSSSVSDQFYQNCDQN